MSSRYRGFTLIELLIVILIAAILALIAYPNMHAWIAARRSASYAEQIANALRFARNEAVRLNMPVYLCPVKIKEDGTSNSCDPKSAGQGILVYADKNRNTVYRNDKEDISLRTLLLNGSASEQGEADAPQISYRFQHIPLGASSPSSAAALFWSFLPDGSFGYADKLSASSFRYSDGRLKISLTDAAADTPESRQARSAVLLVDGGGRVEICPRSSEASELCRYPESEQ